MQRITACKLVQWHAYCVCDGELAQCKQSRLVEVSSLQRITCLVSNVRQVQAIFKVNTIQQHACECVLAQHDQSQLVEVSSMQYLPSAGKMGVGGVVSTSLTASTACTSNTKSHRFPCCLHLQHCVTCLMRFQKCITSNTKSSQVYRCLHLQHCFTCLMRSQTSIALQSHTGLFVACVSLPCMFDEVQNGASPAMQSDTGVGIACM